MLVSSCVLRGDGFLEAPTPVFFWMGPLMCYWPLPNPISSSLFLLLWVFFWNFLAKKTFLPIAPSSFRLPSSLLRPLVCSSLATGFSTNQFFFTPFYGAQRTLFVAPGVLIHTELYLEVTLALWCPFFHATAPPQVYTNHSQSIVLGETPPFPCQ